MSAKQQNTAAMTPFNKIFIDAEENARHDLTKIDELASSIDTHGLMTALTVIVGGPEGFDFTLDAGYRRSAALKQLKWGAKEVPIVITSDKDRAIKNLVENIERQDLPSIDLAVRLAMLEAGTAPKSSERYTKKDLAAKLGMSLSHVSNLIRADKNLIIEAKKLWRKHNIPTTTIFAWAGLNEEEQLAAIAKWQRDLEKSKEREAAAKAKASGGGEDEGGGDDGGGEEESGPKPLVKGKKASLLESYKEILDWKMETGLIKGAADKEAAIRQIDTLRFLLGDLVKFPGVTATDAKDYAKWLKAQEAAEAEAEEEEEAE